MSEWKTFEEAVAEIHGNPHDIGLNTYLNVRKCKHVPSPSWDTRPHRVVRLGNSPTIQVLDGKDWVEAGLSPPQQARLTATGPHTRSTEFRTKTRSILFMDVSGWSRLSAAEIHAYVVQAMPKLADHLVKQDFLNTWGDAIVATFESAKDAAETALNLRDFFHKSYAHDGVAPGLSCRISLHSGEAIIGLNTLMNRDDIFGHSVHVAARLEPATSVGCVFCTKSFADRLAEIEGSAPKAWSFGQVQLPKGFGIVDAYVVTWPGEPDPGLKPEKVEKHTMPLDVDPSLKLEALKSAWPIQRALVVDFAPLDDALVVVREAYTQAEVDLRVLNCAPFPVKAVAIHLRWELRSRDAEQVEPFLDDGEKDVEDEFCLIQPGDSQVFKVSIQGKAMGPTVPAVLRLGTVGHVVASSEPWGGNQKRPIGAFKWGYVLDYRRPT